MDERDVGPQNWPKRRWNQWDASCRRYYWLRGLFGSQLICDFSAFWRICLSRYGFTGNSVFRSPDDDYSLAFDEDVVQSHFLEHFSNRVIQAKPGKADVGPLICKIRWNSGLHSSGLIPKPKQLADGKVVCSDGNHSIGADDNSSAPLRIRGRRTEED